MDNKFISLRYGAFKDICSILSIDYNQTTVCDVNDISYICFHIVKRQTNKIICISQQSSIFDISQFHPSQIANMKIHYKSFNTEFNFNPTSNKMITSEYIDELCVVIKNIILEIMHNLNSSSCEKKHVYEDKMRDIWHFKKSDDDSCKGYFNPNVTYYLQLVDEVPTTIQKIGNVNNLFNFINYNLDYLTEPSAFVITIMKKFIEIKRDVNNAIYNIINANNIIYDDIIICINVLDTMTKLSYKLTHKFGNINIEA